MTRYAVRLCGVDDEPVVPPAGDCPNVAGHTPAPASYLGWHSWAERMGRTHVQRRCPGCELYVVWVPKGGADA